MPATATFNLILTPTPTLTLTLTLTPILAPFQANSPLARDLYSDDVGASALFMCSPLAVGVTGVTMYEH